MRLTRRETLRLAGCGAITAITGGRGALAQETGTNDRQRRIAKVIGEYEAQGFHRTATTVDEESGRWLADQVGQAGLHATLEPFPVDRIDLQTCTCTIADRQIDGIPLFDGRFTSPEGVRGRLGALGSEAEIGLAEKVPVNRADTGDLGKARQADRHLAIIAVTQGGSPGLCPSNASSFLEFSGPPVLQVSSVEGEWLAEQARRGSDARVVAHATRTATTACNVTAELEGTEPTLAPVVVMTPRSGWYWCGSERGGGIACWLEIIRGMATTRTRRTVLFVASSGHELGHLGINAFMASREGIVKNAIAWLHLGANIGAATASMDVLFRASPELGPAVTDALQAVGINVPTGTAQSAVPSGEAGAVYSGGGRYASVICRGNTLFHNIRDRGPDATRPQVVESFSRAFIEVTRSLAGVA